MSIDMAQFHAVFFEESFEGLEVMETGLLNLDLGAADLETVNDIFRAAHSIKGGGGTFGFSHISDFTHVLETLLDEMRSSMRLVTQESVAVLLQSVDCLREMLSATKDGRDYDAPAAELVQQQLQAVLVGGDAAPTVVGEALVASTASMVEGWNIEFSPHPSMMCGGNDPLRLIRELAALGALEVTANLDALPDLKDLDPEQCHLSWRLVLSAPVGEAEVMDVFSWVDDECDLVVTPLASADPDTATPPVIEAVPAAVERRDVSERRNTERRESKSSAKSSRAATTPKDGGSIHVNTDKVDVLINLVGELVITQSMLSQFGEGEDHIDREKLKEGLAQLERHTRELQENVMQIRMLPISFSFNRFPRLVHDLSQKLNKKIELKLSGENTEVDKTVLEKIGDPLVHLVRNSLDHGIETPAARVAAGKPETASLQLTAGHKGGNIFIEVIDDGAGLNTERILDKAIEQGIVSEDDSLSEEKIHNLIFQPGFSTASEVSDVSGRGVGMDVVRRNITDVGGNVSVKSQTGKGSTVTIRLPLTLAILDGQLVRVGNDRFIVPLVSIIESVQIDPQSVEGIAGRTELYKLRNEYIPIIRLRDVCGLDTGGTNLPDGLLVVVETEGKWVGLFVDDLLGQQQVVIKSLETNFKQLPGIAGATILGDGKVALILDIGGLVEIQEQLSVQSQQVA